VSAPRYVQIKPLLNDCTGTEGFPMEESISAARIRKGVLLSLDSVKKYNCTVKER
jgi:hypothetical protein